MARLSEMNIIERLQARAQAAGWAAEDLDKVRGSAPAPILKRAEASDLFFAATFLEEVREVLEELGNEEFKAAPGMSIYAAAANELPRRAKIARALLAKMKD